MRGYKDIMKRLKISEMTQRQLLDSLTKKNKICCEKCPSMAQFITKLDLTGKGYCGLHYKKL